jgi:hypothetical protein
MSIIYDDGFFAAGETIWIGLHSSTNTQVLRYGYEVVANQLRWGADSLVDGLNDVAPTTYALDAKRMSIYVAYTPAGSTSPSTGSRVYAAGGRIYTPGARSFIGGAKVQNVGGGGV